MMTSVADHLRGTLTVLAAIACLQVSLAYAESAGESAPTATPSPTPLSLVSLSEDIEALDELRRRLGRQLDDSTVIEDVGVSLTNLESAVFPDLESQADALDSDPRLIDLLDVDTAARSLNEQLAVNIAALGNEVHHAEKALEEIGQSGESWRQLAETSAAADGPAVLRGRAEEAQKVLAELEVSVRGRRDRALEFLDRTTRLRTETTDLRDVVADRIAEFQKENLAAASQPLWRIGLQSPQSMAHAMQHSTSGDLHRVADYFRKHGVRVILVFIGVVVAGLIASLLVRRRLERTAISEQGVEMSPVLAHPASAAVLLALIAAKVLAPPGPQVVSHIFWALMALPAAQLTTSLLGRRSVLPIALVAATVLVWPFRAYFEAVPLLDRALLIAEDAAGMAAVLLFLRRGLVTDRLSGGWRTAARSLMWAVGVVLTASLITAVFGELGLARLLRDGAVVSLGLAMVIYGAARALLRIVGDVFRGPVGARVRMVRNHLESSLAVLRSTIIVASLAAWAWLSLEAFQLARPLKSALQSLLAAGIEVGWFDLTVGEALAFFGAVAAAFVIAKVVCFILDEEFLPRLPLGRGVPYMISTSVRYLILLAGFAFAVAALGVDLSKATILAGAFGVGLGFGLQNVVNNFVSGLILLFERPIRVGDVVEVAGVRGEVSRIGIRSSTVSTPAGSEVIVPNGDLISKDVTNWTLTNRQRLVEVLTGVAYGSDPRAVKEILERVAGEHAETLDDPPPKAFFISFGDSQLDFRLICWVADYGDGYRVASELRMAVAEAFAQAGIEIPFPQQELHVKSGVDPAQPVVPLEREDDSPPDSRS